MRARLASLGFTLVTGTHALSGPERSFRLKFKGISPLEVVSETLRLFGRGEGVRGVRGDGGRRRGGAGGRRCPLPRRHRRGGRHRLRHPPAHQNTFLDLRVREVICKPW